MPRPIWPERLVFPAFAWDKQSVNDLGEGILRYDLSFLVFEGSGYVVSGNALNSGDRITASAGVNSLACDLFVTHFGADIWVETNATLNLTGNIEVEPGDGVELVVRAV